jgi:carbamoyltransferase
VCLAGGVSLNSLANGKLQSALPLNLYIHPSAGDAGGALGAALFYYHSVCNKPRQLNFNLNPYLGKNYDDANCKQAINNAGANVRNYFKNDKDLVTEIAKLLSNGAVVGWGQGRFEWGPRALGNRSILANPTLPEIQKIVNEKIKFREPFRPFAPAVLAEKAHEYFDIPNKYTVGCPEQYMLSVAKVLPDKQKILPAITHVDGTARVQLVTAESDKLFYMLLSAFYELTGVPVLLNTSFNLRGEPMVSSPRDMIKTFSWSNMDYLIMNRFVIDREISVA